MTISVERLRRFVSDTFSPARARHILSCEETAVWLAPKFGADIQEAREAALLHDITKEKTDEEQLMLCELYGIILDNVEKNEKSLLHALTGAALAAQEFGASPEVCRAVRYHTTGRAGMSPLERTICLADYIEPARRFEGVEQLRALARRDPNRSLQRAMENSMQHVMRRGRLLHPDTLYARNALINEKRDVI